MDLRVAPTESPLDPTKPPRAGPADLGPFERFYRAVADSDAVRPTEKLDAAGLTTPCALYVDTLDSVGGTSTTELIEKHEAAVRRLQNVRDEEWGAWLTEVKGRLGLIETPMIEVRGAKWLHAVGIDSLPELAGQDAVTLRNRCAAYAARGIDEPALGKAPKLAEVRTWVCAAQPYLKRLQRITSLLHCLVELCSPRSGQRNGRAYF
jgi:hypothetical protein